MQQHEQRREGGRRNYFGMQVPPLHCGGGGQAGMLDGLLRCGHGSARARAGRFGCAPLLPRAGQHKVVAMRRGRALPVRALLCVAAAVARRLELAQEMLEPRGREGAHE